MVCDLCNASTDVDPSRVYSPSAFRAMAARGLQPDETMLTMFTAMGLSRDQALAHWKTNIVGRLRPIGFFAQRARQKPADVSSGEGIRKEWMRTKRQL